VFTTGAGKSYDAPGLAPRNPGCVASSAIAGMTAPHLAPGRDIQARTAHWHVCDQALQWPSAGHSRLAREAGPNAGATLAVRAARARQ
jgi:hypothetical protein